MAESPAEAHSPEARKVAEAGRVAQDRVGSAALAAAGKAVKGALEVPVKVLHSAECAKAARVGANQAARHADKDAAAGKRAEAGRDKVASAVSAEAGRVAGAAVSSPANNASKCANECSNSWEAGTSNP